MHSSRRYLAVLLIVSSAIYHSGTGETIQPTTINNICTCNCPATPFVNETAQEVLLEQMKEENTKLKEKLLLYGNPTAENHDIQFVNRITSDYAIFYDVLKHDLSEFTLSFWMQTNDITNQAEGTMLSYSTKGFDNSISLVGTKNPLLWILNQHIKIQVELNDGKWHHVLITWKNKVGTWSLYKDGIIVDNGSGVKIGKTISHLGVLVFGQEQDSYGGSFDVKQCYIGQLSQVHIWDKVLSQQEINTLSQKCIGHDMEGNMFKWDETSMRVGMRGNVKVYGQSACHK